MQMYYEFTFIHRDLFLSYIFFKIIAYIRFFLILLFKYSYFKNRFYDT